MHEIYLGKLEIQRQTTFVLVPRIGIPSSIHRGRGEFRVEKQLPGI